MQLFQSAFPWNLLRVGPHIQTKTLYVGKCSLHASHAQVQRQCCSGVLCSLEATPSASRPWLHLGRDDDDGMR
jgi:hypothetical protein